MKQYEEVIEAMERNGGFSTLARLYQNVDVSGWKTKTPFASIRRIVQTSGYFVRIRPGLWALKSLENSVLERLNIDVKPNSRKDEQFNHSYYQGLLLEIGKWEGYDTFVPNQDKNKKFLNKSLSEAASLKEFYNFTYDRIIKRASTIDVCWFNKRKFISRVYEVEHSTDFNNSLLKFMELQDFRIEFRIVADQKREKEFNNKIESIAFEPIKDLVRFVSYDFVSRHHYNAFKATISRDNI